MNIVEQIKKDVLEKSDWYKEQDEGHYDFWENHIKYVYKEAVELAEKNDADMEIVELGALLHDIALMSKVGTKVDHHENGRVIAEKILTEYDYPVEKRERVLDCVLHHRSSKNAKNIEELYVADADILSHFDNIIMLFSCIFVKNDIKDCLEARKAIKEMFAKDFDDLSDKTKPEFEGRYKTILEVVLRE